MWIALQHAREIRSFLGTPGPVTGEALCAALNLPLDEFPFPGRVTAIYCRERIAFKPGIPTWRMDHEIFHEVGHHVIHGPRGGHDFWLKRDRVMFWKQERQATEFAYFTALPGDMLSLMLCDGMMVREIARAYDRSNLWVKRRIALAWDAGELDALKRQMWVA